MRAGWFIVVSSIFAAASGAITLVTPPAIGAAGCNQNPSREVFLAYCTHPKFNDYEHGAYYLGLEPQAISSLKQASVVILGSSVAQMAFPTDATNSYFNERNLHPYVFGFGYTESGRFPAAILPGLSPRARLYIIHEYAFFSDLFSAAAKDAMGDNGSVHYGAKKVGAAIARWICQYRWNWCGGHGSIYRRQDTGFWEWSTYDSGVGIRPIPTTLPKAGPPSAGELANAERFVASLNVPPQCVILTVTPNLDFDQSEQTRLIALHIHATALIPQLDGLSSLDGFHLDKVSNERWSAAFFDGLDAAAKGCFDYSKTKGSALNQNEQP
jgi:hypothetical protein